MTPSCAPCNTCVTMVLMLLCCAAFVSLRSACGRTSAVAWAPIAAVGWVHTSVQATCSVTASASSCVAAGSELRCCEDSLQVGCSMGGLSCSRRTEAAGCSRCRCFCTCCNALYRSGPPWQTKCHVPGCQSVMLGRLSKTSKRSTGRWVVTLLHSVGTPGCVLCARASYARAVPHSAAMLNAIKMINRFGTPSPRRCICWLSLPTSPRCTAASTPGTIWHARQPGVCK